MHDASVTDLIQPFQIEAIGVRGRLVRLGPALHDALSRHGYPAVVEAILAETIALAAALASMLKYDGIFTLHVHGNGSIRALLADVTTAGGFRSYARFDKDRLQAVPSQAASVPQLLGSGYIAFTVDQGAATDRYQGITELNGATLAECAQASFRQSQQLETAIVLAAGAAHSGVGPRAGALMIQRLPPGADVDDTAEDDWRRAVILTSTVRAGELLNEALAPNDLLYRHYHEDGVRVFRPRPLRHACRCSRRKVEATLRALPRAEIDTLLEDGRLAVTCEFCKTDYVFDKADLDALFAIT